MKKLPKKVQSLFSSSGQIHSYIRAVQELVYNSLDAESTCIAIRFNTQEGKIQVIDNGFGISQCDLTFVGERYMTSKFTDMNGFKSTPIKYGWRGCSLVNLIEVSHTIKITTRYSKTQDTWVKSFRKARGGEICKSHVRPSRGTTVEVKGFLYNLHIQRECINILNEKNNIKLFLQQLSLVHYNKSFSVRDDSMNEIIFKLNKNVDIYQTLSTLFSIKNADFQELKVEKNHYEVTAYIAKKSSTANRTRWIYLNGKYVNNNKLYRIVNNMLNKLLYPRLDTIKKNRKMQNADNVAEFITNKTLPFYFIFISCPYRDYDISYTTDESILEFKNWDLINNLLEKLIKFYNGEVTLLQEKKCVVTKTSANVGETKHRVNDIIQKILRNTKNPGTSQIQNGIKGKSVKRKRKKSKLNAPIRRLTLETKTENNNLKSIAVNDIHNLQALKSSTAAINAGPELMCDHRSNTPVKMKNVFQNAEFEYDIFKVNNNNNQPKDKKDITINDSEVSVDKSKQIVNKQTRNRGTSRKKEAQKKIFVNKSIQCNQEVTKINSSNKKGNRYLTIKKFKPLDNNKLVWKSIKEKSFKTTYDLVQTILESKTKYEENELVNHCFKIPKPKKCIATNIQKQITPYKAESSLDQSIFRSTYQSHHYSKSRKETTKARNDYESKYKFVKDKNENNFINRHWKYNFDEIKDISNNCKILQRKQNNIENIFRTKKSYNKRRSIFNLSNYKETSFTIHESESSSCYNFFSEINNKKNGDVFNFCLESSHLNFECQTIISNTTNNEFKFGGIKEILYKHADNNTSNSKTYSNGYNRKLLTTHYINENNTNNKQTYGNISPRKTGTDKACETKNNSIWKLETDKRNCIIENNECMKLLYETFTINRSLTDVLWHTQIIQDISLNEEILAVDDHNQTHNNKFSNTKLPKSPSDDKNEKHVNNIDPLNVCEAILGCDNKDVDSVQNIGKKTKCDENYLSQGLEKMDTTDTIALINFPNTSINDQNDIIENSETENRLESCIPCLKKVEKVTKDVFEGKSMLECSKVNDREEFCNIEVDNEIVDTNNFHFKNRLHFLPKGMSPIFQNCNLKISSDCRVEEGYYESNIYNDFANNININSEVFKPDVQNLGELTTKDIFKANRKLTKENASLVFDGHSLKHAKIYRQIDDKFIAATLFGSCNKTDQLLEVFVLFDQHAVHERINLEKKLSEYFDGSKWTSVALHNGIPLKLTKDDVVYMHNYAEKLGQLGLQWTILNGTEVSINAIPKAILGNNLRPVEMVIESVKKLILEEIEIFKSQRGCVSMYPKSIMDLVFSEACRYAIKFGDKLSKRQCVDMLSDLSECKTPFQCAHGRPVMAVLLDIKHNECQYKVNNTKLKKLKNILCNLNK